MGVILRFIAIGSAVALVVGVVGLFIMAGVAAGHGVERVQIPVDSYIALVAAAADYADAYRAPMPYGGYRNIDEVIAKAFKKGREVYRGDEEVVYEGEARGVHYMVSYILDNKGDPPTLTVATRIRYVTDQGRWYFRVERPIHRRLTPIMLDQMASSAANL
jgi:hypothetical protein